MKRVLIALYGALIVLLSSCSEPLLSLPLTYADQTEREDGIFLQSATTQQDSIKKESVKTPSVSPTPDISEAIENADESLPGGDNTPIIDLSVPHDGSGETPPDDELAVYDHYIKTNDARYHSFLTAFPNLSIATSLALVNVNADYGYYKTVTMIEDPDDLLVLCNKNYQLPSDFVPENLRGVAGTSYKMTDEAATAFEQMKKAIKDELGLTLTVLSGYRDYSYQKALYSRYASADGVEVADTYSARAGHSEHQTGLAVDFLHKSPSTSLRAANFQNTAQYAWLQAHAHEYGFILRYPEGYESITGYRFEPWHWRYIGVDDATCMDDEGIMTFEEYIGTYYIVPRAVNAREAG